MNNQSVEIHQIETKAGRVIFTPPIVFTRHDNSFYYSDFYPRHPHIVWRDAHTELINEVTHVWNVFALAHDRDLDVSARPLRQRLLARGKLQRTSCPDHLSLIP